MENAGGSQVPRCVVNAMAEYFTYHYAQLGAGHPRSQRATQIVRDAHSWLEVLMNTAGEGQVVIGSSTSQLAFNLASAFAAVLGPGDSLVLQEASHESVLGPWVRLAERSGSTVRWWRADPGSGGSALAELEGLLDGSTRLVVVTHVSNLLGEILDLAGLVQLVRHRAPQAQVLADGVAFAPHRAMDVSGWGVDWYLWSAYKVYGPHVAVMYGRHQAFQSLLAQGGQGPNHYFVPPTDLTYKFELGGASHEGCAGILALQDYLLQLLDQLGPQPDHCTGSSHHAPGQSAPSAASPPADTATDSAAASPRHAHGKGQAAAAAAGASAAAGGSGSGQAGDPVARSSGASTPPKQASAVMRGCPPGKQPAPFPLLRGVYVTRQQVEAAFALMTQLEVPLQERLLSYLAAHPAVRLVGSSDPDSRLRVPTISFVHRTKSSERVSRELQAAGFAVRNGHMYARRLVEALATEGGLLAAEAAARQADGGLRLGAAHGSGHSGGTATPPGLDLSLGFDVDWAVDDGVVRVSLLHYNTPGEVAGLIEAMGRVL